MEYVDDSIAVMSINGVEGRNLPGYNRINLTRIFVLQNEDENPAPEMNGVVIHRQEFSLFRIYFAPKYYPKLIPLRFTHSSHPMMTNSTAITTNFPLT